MVDAAAKCNRVFCCFYLTVLLTEKISNTIEVLFFSEKNYAEPLREKITSENSEIVTNQINNLVRDFKNVDKDILELHIAHNEGNYFCTKAQLKEIEDNEQVAINYCDKDGKTEEQYNPNGSIKNIAGILNKEKNVLGMMPHPERMIDESLSGEDGSLFFNNLINNLK